MCGSHRSQCESKTNSQSVDATSSAALSSRACRRRSCCSGFDAAFWPAAGTVGSARCAWADQAPVTSTSLVLDMSAWNLDADNGVWWQVGAPYCANPATLDYETLGIYVPQAYMTGAVNNDGQTYTCQLDAAGQAESYTCAMAPLVIPVNTAGYSAQPAPTSYSYDSLASYIEAGLVYVYPGCRGRANGYAQDGSLTFAGGAPWGW